MATPAPGADIGPEEIPRQVVYRRFASETRTVEVTSTAPWDPKDLRPDPEKESPKFTNPKEQTDKALKWTIKQPCLKKETQNQDGNRRTQKNESMAKPTSHSIINRYKPNISKADTKVGEEAPHFGGRRLSLCARDKVVGGAAMAFADPLDCGKTLSGERRKSEYDAGRLSSVAFARPESRRLTEPTIEEHKIQSTLRICQRPTAENVASALKPDPKIASQENADVTSSKHVVREKDDHYLKKAGENSSNCLNLPENTQDVKVRDNKTTASSNAPVHKTTGKSAFQSCPKVNSESSHCLYSEKPNTDVREMSHIQSSGKINRSGANSSFSKSGDIKSCEPKTKETEIGALSRESILHPESEKIILKAQPDLTVQEENSYFSRQLNEPHCEAKVESDKLQKSPNASATGSLSRSNKAGAFPHPEITSSSLLRSQNISSSFSHSENSQVKNPTSALPRSENTNRSISNYDTLNSQLNTLRCSESTISEKTNKLQKSPDANIHSSLSRSENTNIASPRFENTNSALSRTENVNTSFPRSESAKSSFLSAGETRASEPKMEEGSKIVSAGMSSKSVFHTDKCPSRIEQTETSFVSSLKSSSRNTLKNEKGEITSTPIERLHQRKDKITDQKYPESGLQRKDHSPENKTRYNENHNTENEHDVFAMKTQTDKSACHLTKATIGDRPKSALHEKTMDTSDLNQSKLQRNKKSATSISTMSSPKEASTSPHSLNMTKSHGFGKTESRGTNNEELIPTTVHSTERMQNVPKNNEKTASVSATAHPNLSTISDRTTASSQNAQGQRLTDTRAKTGESDRRNVCSSSKHEPRVNSREPLALRPVTRSKSDVGEGNRGRSAALTPTRKSCAERRCCGAQLGSGLLQEAVATSVTRARSLSRGPPMGSTASLALKNKSSWTTQHALQSEVEQLKRELQMHKAEELRLHREIHKLRSVLQQATSFGDELTGAGDPHDDALLVSLQDRHGMAGAGGIPVSANKKQGVSGESCEPESMEVPRHEKDMSSRQLIKAAILDNDFLKNLTRSQIRELVDCMYPQRVQAGSYVIREGEAGSHLYVLDDGEMEVLKEGTVLGRMGPGKAFGELAILYNCTRTASIRAVSDLQVWVLDRRAFQQIMMRTGIQRLEDNIAFLRSVPLLRGINDQTLVRIADGLEPEFYPTDEYIVRQGARGNTFFIISGGSVEVTQRGTNGHEVVLRTLGRGEYFGEQALLRDDCRTASVRALAPGVDCLTLDREIFRKGRYEGMSFMRRSFNALIGSLKELHLKDYAEDPKSQSSRTSFNNDYRKEDEAVSSLHLDELRPLGTLGVGGFGCVRLVMAPNGSSYALKCLSKRHVAATGQQEHVAAERDVLLAARSPFIVRLLRTFRDEANVYLLLEACLGGEVWALLREHERLPDKAARFIAACVLEALDYLHARDTVYRDLKPENLVMDAEGYVKLVDFGFCKRLPGGCKTWTFCGTPEYVAPEVILNRGHDRAADYWALGVLIYELLTGVPPFVATDPMGTYNLILLGMDSAVMPKYMSRTSTHLIKRLCRAAPSERLGYQRGSFREVRAHRWFQDFDWDALRTQSMTPPIKPQTLDKEFAPAELSHWDADF